MSWDSNREPGNRVLGVWRQDKAPDEDEDGKNHDDLTPVNGEAVERSGNFLTVAPGVYITNVDPPGTPQHATSS